MISSHQPPDQQTNLQELVDEFGDPRLPNGERFVAQGTTLGFEFGPERRSEMRSIETNYADGPRSTLRLRLRKTCAWTMTLSLIGFVVLVATFA
jgi:hypothetical protein